MLRAFETCPVEHGCCTYLDVRDSQIIRQLIAETLTILDEPATNVTALLKAVIGEETVYEQPQDLALQKLLPPMSLQQGEANSLRALTEDSLRSEKSARLRRLSQDLCATEVGSEQSTSRIFIDNLCVWDWLVAINDLRLVLAGELDFQGVQLMGDIRLLLQMTFSAQQKEASDTFDPREIKAIDLADVQDKLEITGMDSHRALLYATYIILTWWQDSLLASLPK